MASGMTITLGELVKRFGGEVVGDGAHAVGSLAPLDKAGPRSSRFSRIRSICPKSRRRAPAPC